MGLFDAAESAMADLEGRVAALEGETVEPPVEYEDSGPLTLASNQTIINKRITGYPLAINTSSNASGQATNDATVRDVLVENANQFGMKIGDGPSSYRILVERLRALQCRQPLYLGCLRDSVFNDVELDAVTTDVAKDHALYLSSGCVNVAFHGMVLRCEGEGSALHLYGEGDPSDTLVFEDVYADGQTTGQLFVAVSGFRNIVIKRLTAVNMRIGYPLFRIGCENLLVEDFDVSGGSALIQGGGWCGTPVNCVFRNGIYRSSAAFIAGESTGITLENVVRG